MNEVGKEGNSMMVNPLGCSLTHAWSLRRRFHTRITASQSPFSSSHLSPNLHPSRHQQATWFLCKIQLKYSILTTAHKKMYQDCIGSVHLMSCG